MSEANKVQIGGNHYSKRGSVQHWDLVAKNGWGYYVGNITKYLFRWRDKNGLQDLEKSKHYLAKYVELCSDPRIVIVNAPPDGAYTLDEIIALFDLDYYQGTVVGFLLKWQATGNQAELQEASFVIDRYIDATRLQDIKVMPEAEAAELNRRMLEHTWDAHRDEGSNLHPAEPPVEPIDRYLIGADGLSVRDHKLNAWVCRADDAEMAQAVCRALNRAAPAGLLAPTGAAPGGGAPGQAPAGGAAPGRQ